MTVQGSIVRPRMYIWSEIWQPQEGVKSKFNSEPRNVSRTVGRSMLWLESKSFAAIQFILTE